MGRVEELIQHLAVVGRKIYDLEEELRAPRNAVERLESLLALKQSERDEMMDELRRILADEMERG